MADHVLHGFQIAERHLVEAADRFTEAFQILRISARRDRRQRAPVERAFEGDDAPAFRRAVDVMIAPRRLDRPFAGFRARVAEEHLVRERDLDEPLGQRLLSRDPIEVRRVPELAGLLGQRRDEPGMRMPQSIHRDAGRKVEIGVTGFRIEPGPFTSCEDKVLPGVRTHHGSGRGTSARIGPDRHWSHARLCHRGSP